MGEGGRQCDEEQTRANDDGSESNDGDFGAKGVDLEVIKKWWD